MPDDTPATNVPALGFSLTANIDGGRQIVFQSFVPLDASPEQQRDAVDRALDLADYSEKRYTIKGLKIALASHEEALRKTEKAVEEQNAKIGSLTAAYEREWNASNKRGEFELKGVQKTNIDNANVTLENNKQSIINLRDQIARTQEKIAELAGAAAT